MESYTYIVDKFIARQATPTSLTSSSLARLHTYITDKFLSRAKLHLHLHRRSMPGSWCLHCHAEFQGHRCKALTEYEKSVIVLLTPEAQTIPYRWGGKKLPNTYKSGEYGCAGWLCAEWTAHERRAGAWCGDSLCKFCGAYVESMGPSLEVNTHHVKWQTRC